MPELGILSNGSLSIPQTSILPPSSYFDRTPIPAPVVDTSRLSKAQGKAALFGSIADTLAKLPETLMSAYQAGKKMTTGNQTVNAYNAALAGKPLPGTSLADFKATGEGAVAFAPASPEEAEINRLKIAALQAKTQPKRTLYDSFPPGSSALPAATPETMPSASGQLSKFDLSSTGEDAPMADEVPGLTNADAAPISPAEMLQMEKNGQLQKIDIDPDPNPPPTTAQLSLFPDNMPEPMTKRNGRPVAPAVVAPGITEDPVTRVRTVTGADGNVFQIRPDEPDKMIPVVDKSKAATGVAFPSAEAATAAGFDPTGAKVNADGTITVENFKATGTDAKGRAKITDAQKNALGGAAVLAKSIDDLLGEYDKLAAGKMAGPINGRIEKGKQSLGVGSEEGSKIQAEMNTSLFKIARMLNGAGVLTDKDISRATNVAPTITMGRAQFKGQLEAVKGSIRDSLGVWLQTNAGQATDEQVALANEAIASLDGKPKSAPQPSARVNSQAEYDALPSGATYIDSKGQTARKR